MFRFIGICLKRINLTWLNILKKYNKLHKGLTWKAKF